jgi:hypothetical protein
MHRALTAIINTPTMDTTLRIIARVLEDPLWLVGVVVFVSFERG